MRVLIIEDSDYKIDHLCELLAEVLPDASVTVARAFRTAIVRLAELQPDLVLLDMSLPTFEAGPREAGGRTRPFGGREILREMDAVGVAARVIVVTQFDSFGEGRRSVSRDQLMQELKSEFPELIAGGVYYNGADSRWRDALKGILLKLKQ
jgi:CheY-like chemotaxis protein